MQENRVLLPQHHKDRVQQLGYFTQHENLDPKPHGTIAIQRLGRPAQHLKEEEGRNRKMNPFDFRSSLLSRLPTLPTPSSLPNNQGLECQPRILPLSFPLLVLPSSPNVPPSLPSPLPPSFLPLQSPRP